MAFGNKYPPELNSTRVLHMEGKMRKICNFCGAELERKNIARYYFCNVNCKGKWQVLQREQLGYTKEWIIDQYCVQGKSFDQIAREINRDTKSVYRWARDYGIKTRPRGTDYGQAFKKGQVSYFKGKKQSEEAKEKMRQRRLADGHVPYLKDGIHWLKHEGAVPASWKGGITPERQSVYASIEWVEAVKQVWARDNATCQLCGKKHNETKNRGTFHIHHIIPFTVKSYRCVVSNLILLCRKCHLWVHSKKNTTGALIDNNGTTHAQ